MRPWLLTMLALTLWVPVVQAAPPPLPCTIFPADNVWNTPINTLPVHAKSSQYINSIGPTTGLHPDFGSGRYNGAPIGIPYTLVPGNQPLVPMIFGYSDESDPGPYPIPSNAKIEGGRQSTGDRHVLTLDVQRCILYETYYSFPLANGSWYAGSGAVYDLASHALRPMGWTSADAAGLPILPGLVRADEVAQGVIPHALRFTVSRTQKAYVWPARHYASSDTDPNVPPMGTRFRLKAGFNLAGYPPQVQVILQALKTYGMIVADNGSNWFISGVPDSRWDNDALRVLDQVKGSDFEAVETSSLVIDPNSGQARQP